MAPTKRARPAFSPPRPVGRPKSNTTAKTTASTNTTARKSRKSDTSKPSTKSSKSKTSKPINSETRRRSRLVSPTPSASDSQADASQDEDHDQNEDEDEELPDQPPNPNPIPSSPEPEYILAEVEVSTTTHPTPSDQVIPLPLIHRILQSHFHHSDTTKISTDAREVAGRYIDVFVREAIMRCAYEKTQQQKDGRGGDGWLEVEDLERGAVQLCLDF